MTVGFVPAEVSAQEDTSEETTEIISRREENVKHFDMGNGTYQAIAYSYPIHEKDEEGNWQNIDFSMDLTRQNGKRVYANEAGATAFAASYRANQPIMTLGEEGNSISMTLVTDTPSTWSLFGSSVAAEVTGAEVDIQTLEDAQNANFSNTLLYEEVMPGIDLEYIVDPWCVKENIIVNQPGESYFYRFLLEIDGMYPVMQDDGSILIYSEGTNEPSYGIPAPYMYDADGEESFDVFYNIETTNGDYYLTVFADSDWINAEDRVFPVIIDPSYTDIDALSRDTYINEDAADETRGSYNFFYVGENEVAYIRVPTPELPIGATLEYAALAAYYYYKAKVNYGSVQITAHKVTGFDWEEDTLTWNSVVASDPVNFGLSTMVLGADNDNAGVVTAYGNIGAYASTPVLTAFDITDAAQSWLNGSPNYGIGLRYVITSPNRSVQFRSTEGPAAHRPMAQYQYSVTPLYEATVNSYYDNGYSVYYGEEHIQSASKIRDYLAAVNNRYMELFGLHLNFSTINYYNSPLDNCKGTVTSGNVGSLCTCGSEHSHLDNASWFFSHAYSGNNTTTNVYWTCHNIISEGADGSIDYNRSYSKETSVYLLELCDSSDRERLSRGVLMHELNHQFGARDHYHDEAIPGNVESCINRPICSECGDNKRPESCIMYNSGLGINNDNILCEACQEDILNHLKGHH